MKWTQKGHEYDNMATIISEKDNVYFIYGWGIVGKAFYEKFSSKINIIGIIDRNPEKWGKHEGIPIISPKQLQLCKNQKIIVATGWVSEVSKVLKEKGFKDRVDYFLLEEFSAIYNFYIENKLHLENVAMVCNELCTLRCEKCVSLIPYNKHRVNYSYDEMKDSADALFNWVDSVGILALGGGDVMLNPELERFIDYLGTHYITRIGKIEVYTNAIIMPKETMLELWKKYKIVVRFTDYSKNAPGIQKISEFLELCENNGIFCEHVRFDNWVDTGFPQESNGITSEEGLINHCKRCSPVICSNVIHKKMFYCSPAGMSYASGLFEEDNDDFFDLSIFDASKKNRAIRVL